MNTSLVQKRLSITLLLALLAFSSSAQAFRCGQKLVREKMHEIEVRNACGAPETTKNLGYVERAVVIAERRGIGGLRTSRNPAYSPFTEQVIRTEYVYNFGPRKLMRRLVFEGGILIRIETIGYGFIRKKPKQ